jgi:hypothetical protein
MVTGVLSWPSPLNVNCDMALLSEGILGDISRDMWVHVLTCILGGMLRA